MAKKSSHRNLPRSRRTKEQLRQEYRKSLAVKPVSETLETEELPDVESTSYKTPPEAYKQPPTERKWAFSLTKGQKIISIIVSVALLFGGIIYKYGIFTNSIQNLEKRLDKMEEDFKKDIRNLTERIDKYVSKERKQ